MELRSQPFGNRLKVVRSSLAATELEFRHAPSVSRQLESDGKCQKEDRKPALNTALGGVWHEARAHEALKKYEVGEQCVRHGEAVENL
eukprot:6240119-Amphidinium_carterae.1